MIPVVLCGGSGSRLWPLSRKSLPKQFIALAGNRSLLERTLERVKPLAQGTSPKVLCVSSEEHRFLVDAAARSQDVAVEQILEPVPRNTAAAMAMAALASVGSDLLLFCPADHHIPDATAFGDMVRRGVPAAQSGRLVTFGVHPTHPSTAYGYIQSGEPEANGGCVVQRFVEKPTEDVAASMLLTGQYLWNAGIFLMRADALLHALAQFAPDILQACSHAMQAMVRDGHYLRPNAPAFAACRSQSIDYAVMERADNVSVFPFAGQWSDVGSWASVAALSEADAAGNRTDGQAVILLDTTRTYVRAHERTVVALGTSDLVIVDTPDALLVAQAGQTERIKEVVDRLAAQGNATALAHRKVARPWGWYDSVDSGQHVQVKRLNVRPGAAISLQYHRLRAEHWVVVSGVAQVTKGDEVFELREGESTYIPPGVMHRLSNAGQLDLEMIEVQSGSYLGEDDIIRVQDDYGRAAGGAAC